jgi:formylglycine-generating enzyme required for sulfatase activity
MAWINPGEFIMGSPPSELTRTSWEGPQTEVTISKGFWIGKYEVTQGEYQEVMGTNPSHFTGDANLPVEQVNWFEAVAYCEALTALEQKAGLLTARYAYRLPTAAEWEYSCRAGTTTPFYFGSALLSGMANFDGTTEYPPCDGDPNSCANPDGINILHTMPVGSYQPNAWGLYDMHGNVWEWCQDWFSPSLPGGQLTDPQGPESGSSRVMRGGRWGNDALFCRSAGRGYLPPSSRNASDGYGIDLGANGFRVVLTER